MHYKTQSLPAVPRSKLDLALLAFLLASSIMWITPLYAQETEFIQEEEYIQEDGDDSYVFMDAIVVSASRMEETMRGLSIKPEVMVHPVFAYLTF